MKDFFSILLALIVIPIIGFVTYYLISLNILADSGLSYSSIADVCKYDPVTFFEFCEMAYPIILMGELSIYSAIISILLLISILLCAKISGENRSLNAIFFPILIPVSQLIIVALIVGYGIILTAAMYYGMVFLIGSYFPVVIGLVGLAAAITALKVLLSLLSSFRNIEHSSLAELLEKNKQEKIWDFVTDTANKLGSRLPDNIILGLDPTFYVTSAKVRMPIEKKVLKGETLYLSLPLMTLLSKDELKAIIGHELGHFRGNDLAYTKKFAPGYISLQKSINKIEESDSITMLPVVFLLDYLLRSFSVNEKKISRYRELQADKAAVEVTSSESFALSLIKVATFSHKWNDIQTENINRINKGRINNNIARTYSDSIKLDIEKAEIASIISTAMKEKIAHPTDTHPTISERFEAIGFSPDKVNIEDLNVIENSSIELLDENNELDIKLSSKENLLMVALGLATPKEADKKEDFHKILYILAAKILTADGVLDKNEYEIAESLGKDFIQDFDTVEFRSICHDIDSFPSASEVAKVYQSLSDELKKEILGYLDKIADADSEISIEEKQVIKDVKETWGI